ncbi:MAG TPA: S8 family peptidase [Chloroflexota bacterium]|nr:S8 family peptidase [Chloroflexota bacterium]
MLDRTVIAVPLLTRLAGEDAARAADPRQEPIVYSVIIDANLAYGEGREGARQRIRQLVGEIVSEPGSAPGEGVNNAKTDVSQQYVFAQLQGRAIRELVRRDAAGGGQRAIYHIWPDFPVKALLIKSVRTVKADAAMASFSAFGEDITWAVLDSGIDAGHRHFKAHRNVSTGLDEDFTGGSQPLVDNFGHGTHVAGIIAGEARAPTGRNRTEGPLRAFSRYRDEHGEIKYETLELDGICGMAPRAKLVSMKVLDEHGDGLASNLITALEKIQQINGNGRWLRIHGVNMSVGYDFEPEWFACGQSPLCVEVDRLVRSGVVVVVAAGNTGYGWAQSEARGAVTAGLDLTINDPGNAELAITVGSTHRDMPHVYGVSYFSSKGPTGDGRPKPDLVAPGEKILSCAAGEKRADAQSKIGVDCDYVEDSGTSMAAPHVSGVIAAFLSVRREYIGQPESVKEIFLGTATDLKRDRSFQGRGLVDLMRAIQSV